MSAFSRFFCSYILFVYIEGSFFQPPPAARTILGHPLDSRVRHRVQRSARAAAGPSPATRASQRQAVARDPLNRSQPDAAPQRHTTVGRQSRPSFGRTDGPAEHVSECFALPTGGPHEACDSRHCPTRVLKRGHRTPLLPTESNSETRSAWPSSGGILPAAYIYPYLHTKPFKHMGMPPSAPASERRLDYRPQCG